MKYLLKDTSIVRMPELDRLIQFDPRSKAHPVMAQIKVKEPRSYTWRCIPVFDQGKEGGCVGAGIIGELAARPSEVPNLTYEYGRKEIYWPAQRIDPWEGGAYPGASPFYEGTSVLAGVKVAQKLGWFESYYWSFSLEELVIAVGRYGPAVMGTIWTEGMATPDYANTIHVTGASLGGHCYLVRGVDVKRKRFLVLNSWGNLWGEDGNCWISFNDMNVLLKTDGEAVFFKNRHKVAQP